MKEKQVKREEITTMEMNQVKDLTLDLKQLLPPSLLFLFCTRSALPRWRVRAKNKQTNILSTHSPNLKGIWRKCELFRKLCGSNFQ